MILYTLEEVIEDIERHEKGFHVDRASVQKMMGKVWYLQKYSQMYPEPARRRDDPVLIAAFIEDFINSPDNRIPLLDKVPPDGPRWAVYQCLGDGELHECRLEYLQSFYSRMELNYFIKMKANYRYICVIDVELKEADHLKQMLQ